MRVLFVIPSYEPAWAFGGTVTATVNLCRALAKQGVNVTVYTTDADGKGGHLDVPRGQPVELGGVEVWYFRCDFGVSKAFYSRGLACKFKESVREFDIVDVSAIWQWIQVDVSRISRQFSKPYVVTTHGSFSSWIHGQDSLKKDLYWRFFGKKTVRRASAVRFTTEAECEASVEAFPIFSDVPSFVVPNGVDFSEIGSGYMDIRLDSAKDRIVLLYVGRIHRIKGLHLIIEAVSGLNPESFVLMLVGPKGDWGYAEYLRKCSEDVGLDIVWYDAMAKEELWRFYKSSDIFVLPSFHENFSMVAVEAMACGLPVLISRNVGVWREVEADGAGFVVNQNAEEIAGVLKNILMDKNILDEISKNAAESARKRYDIKKVASLMIKAYEDVITGRRSSELKWR